MLEAVMSNAVVSVIRRREVENGQRDEWLRRTRRLRGVSMRTLLAAALTSLLVLGSLTAFAAGPKAKRQAATTPSAAFSSPEQVLRWINGYRHEPEPQRLPRQSGP